MKKNFIITVLAIVMAVFTSIEANAENIFGKGSNLFTATVGFGSHSGSIKLPPVSIAYERGIVNFNKGKAGCLGIGAEVGDYIDNYNNLFLSAYAAYHYLIGGNFEVHARAGLGYYGITYSNETYGCVRYVGYAGATYYFSEKIGICLEAGYGNCSTVRAGIKFNL